MFFTFVAIGSLLVAAPITDDYSGIGLEKYNELSCSDNHDNGYKLCNCTEVKWPSFYYVFSEGVMPCVKHPEKIYEDICVCSKLFEDSDDIFYNDNDPWFLNDSIYLDKQ